MNYLESIIVSTLSELAAARECEATNPSVPVYVPRLRCATCGGSDPVHPSWISLTDRCHSHTVDTLI